jgi:RNA polymerase sigma-70 factor (ECF subfamily)
LQSWLYRIATNCINTYVRSAARYNALLGKSAREAAGPTDRGRLSDDGEEKLSMLKEALLSLKPKYQTVVSLRFFENMSHADIAAIVDAKESTVRSRLTRALRKLRKRLANDFGGPGKEGSSHVRE